jgi:tRNA(fMet)-specific endonuclease VapC
VRRAGVKDATIATCAIVRGELIFMAEFSQQRAINLRHVETFLSRIIVYPIDEEVADWYGSLKARLLDQFGPQAKAKRRRTTLVGIGISATICGLLRLPSGVAALLCRMTATSPASPK